MDERVVPPLERALALGEAEGRGGLVPGELVGLLEPRQRGLELEQLPRKLWGLGPVHRVERDRRVAGDDVVVDAPPADPLGQMVEDDMTINLI